MPVGNAKSSLVPLSQNIVKDALQWAIHTPAIRSKKGIVSDQKSFESSEENTLIPDGEFRKVQTIDLNHQTFLILQKNENFDKLYFKK